MTIASAFKAFGDNSSSSEQFSQRIKFLQNVAFGSPTLAVKRGNASVGWCRLVSAGVGWRRLVSAGVGWCRMVSAGVGWCRLASLV